MITQFYGFKKEQEQVFDKEAYRLVVTLIQAHPLKVTQVKTNKKDAYFALQVKISKDEKKKTKKLLLRELRQKEETALKVGEIIKLADVFKIGDYVQVRGITKGRGFAGVMKRWGFHGGPKTHGQSDRQRAPGSIGQRTTPGRVWKGKKMPGHMGVKAKTVKGLKVYKIDEEKNELWLTGLVPGSKGGLLKISKIKGKRTELNTENKDKKKLPINPE